MTRRVLTPDVNHPITIEPTASRVLVRVGGHLVADSHRALTLRESTYPPVQYVPIADVDETVLRPSDTITYCPYKGDCTYYSVESADGETVDSVVWTYADPYPAVAAIAGHVAFYTDRADVTLTDL
jgi:uncharacterized protein (DUF427 family)